MSEVKKVEEVRAKNGWGVESLPRPSGPAFIQSRDDLCVGCGICEMACSMFHFGVINRELSRIRILKYLIPLSKAIQSICVQCDKKEERECEKACPLDPPAIFYDEKRLHMQADEERCLGSKCGKCREACSAEIPRFYPDHNYPLVCDLCEKDGERRPQCVEVCPNHALEYMPSRDRRYVVSTAHLWRIHPDEKAEFISKRLYPLTKDIVGHW
ncbi:MAG: 4Fe-4S dicluster domain-containing protein [Candidatus Bathyarchaeota archaeon]|nr:4Fe-4S dicluster domain-containing protein [Candidatus Bathyarchaeota archaeon]